MGGQSGRPLAHQLIKQATGLLGHITMKTYGRRIEVPRNAFRRKLTRLTSCAKRERSKVCHFVFSQKVTNMQCNLAFC